MTRLRRGELELALQAMPTPPLPDRRLRADLSRLLRADPPAAPHHQGENTSAAWGVANFLLRLREKYQPRLPRLDQRRRHLVPRAAVPRVQVHPREARRGAAGRLRPRARADPAAARGVPRAAGGGRRATRPTTSSAPSPPTAAGRGLQAVIVSGDKDFYQLIGPGVALLNPGRGGPAAVEETLGGRVQRLRAARRPAGAGGGLPRAGGRQLRQRARGEGHRREGGAEAPARVRRPRHHPGARRRGQRQAGPRGAARAGRQRAALAGAGDASSATCRSSSTSAPSAPCRSPIRRPRSGS